MITTLVLLIRSLALNIFTIIRPLSIGVSILLIALLVAIIFSYSISSWVAFLIFLIYIGGILVIFSYFISLVPNQTINFISSLLLISSTLFILYLISRYLSIKIYIPLQYKSQISIFYLKFNSPTLILLAIILFITIIIVVKITINTKGPLRPFSK